MRPLSIETPGQLYAFRPGREPGVVVTLPLEVRPRPGLHWAYGATFVAVAVLGALLLGLAAAGSPRQSFFEIGLPFVLGAPVLAVFGACGLTLLTDALRRGPSLTVDAEGFHDHRTGLRVAWGDVRSADYRCSRLGVAGLALELASPPPIRQNPFRVGFDKRRRGELIVPMTFLRPDSRVLSYVFERLIEDAGGHVTGKPRPRDG